MINPRDLVELWKPDGSDNLRVMGFEVDKYLAMGFLMERPVQEEAPPPEEKKPIQKVAEPKRKAAPAQSKAPLAHAQDISTRAHRDINTVKRDEILQPLFRLNVNPPDAGTKAQLLEILDEAIEAAITR